MNPRRLHSDTIFSINGFSFGSATKREVFLNDTLMSREAREESVQGGTKNLTGSLLFAAQSVNKAVVVR